MRTYACDKGRREMRARCSLSGYTGNTRLSIAIYRTDPHRGLSLDQTASGTKYPRMGTRGVYIQVCILILTNKQN